MRLQSPRKADWVIFGSLLVIGTVIATLGSVSLPVGDKISNFWPGIVIQVLGGLWFGAAGVIAGVIFPLFSNLLIGGDKTQILGFIPANIAQSLCPLIFYRLFRRKPQISDFSDFGFFILFAAILSMLIAGLFGPAAFYVFGAKPFVLAHYPSEVYAWAIIHFRTLLLLGVPMMIWVSPKVIAARVIKPYWPEESGGSHSYHFLSIKLFFIMGLVTLFPLILVGAYQIATMSRTEILQPNFLAVAINLAFFSLLIISSILTDLAARPIETIIDKIEGLARTHLIHLNLDNIRTGRQRFTHISQAIDELFGKLRSYERARAMQQVASQVAHDIRSPLAALDSVIKDVSQLPEEKRVIIRCAVNRIHDIANNLIEKNRESQMLANADTEASSTAAAAAPASVELLSSHIEPLLTEKRLQFRAKTGIEIDARLDAASYGLFARIQPTEFKRALSNLINNAVEAIPETGTILVHLVRMDGNILLKIQDNGKGIAPELLSKLGQRGETHGKTGGSGLGLYHAKSCAESWGGSLDIQSKVGHGTTVTMRLPRAQAPEWFVSSLDIPPNSTIAVLDDDTSIHQVWQGRFDSLRVKEKNITVRHFSTPDELRAWVKSNAAENALYLTDYELMGYRETGLSLVEELNLGSRAILVTSRYEDKGILDECQRLKVRMIPKGLAGFVPISIRAQSEAPDAVLVDDDPLVRMTWETSAKEKGIKIKTFQQPREFLEIVDQLPKEIPIYLDSRLGDGVYGEDIAKELYARGFKNLYLATGCAVENLPTMPWVKGIIGKEAPWGQSAI